MSKGKSLFIYYYHHFGGIEEIGYYNPMEEPSVVKLDPEKAKKWIENGAQPTDTVRELFKKHGVI